MAAGDPPLIEPQSITLSAAGSGSTSWQNRKLTVMKIAQRITVQSPAATGVVGIYQDGALLTSRSLALYVAAGGPVPLYPGQSIEVRVTGGPAGGLIQCALHSTEEPL